jgi:5,10-methylenetetrahydrofolate reductase
MYRLKINPTESYKYDTKTEDFELHLNGDIIKVSSFSLEKRAQRLVSLARLHRTSHGSRREVTRAIMILLARGFKTKREGDRLVDQLMAGQDVRDDAQAILSQVFYGKAEVLTPYDRVLRTFAVAVAVAM